MRYLPWLLGIMLIWAGPAAAQPAPPAPAAGQKKPSAQVKKPAPDKPPVKPAAKKPAAPKPSPKEPAAKKPAAKKPAPTKPAPKKTAVKKPAAKPRVKKKPSARRKAKKARQRKPARPKPRKAAPIPKSGPTVYVSDRLVVTVRGGPSSKAKVLGRVISGNQLMLLRKRRDGWGLIKFRGGKTGWIRHHYLVRDKPAVVRLRELDPKHKDATKRQALLASERRQLEERLAQAGKKAARLQAELDRLHGEADKVEVLKRRLKKAEAGRDELARRIKDMKTRVRSSAFAGALKWFLSGAAVLFFGLILGLMMGRRRRGWSSIE